tara:strand:+ start:15000 stop:15305 length:306 start_codon:yes stop_codon:yes gene_type:complete
MKVILEACLSEPPSLITCFRDVTLYAACFARVNVLVECPQEQKDSYYHWLKRHGAYDFIDEIIYLNEEDGYRIGTNNPNFRTSKIDYNNLSKVIAFLKNIQ